MIVGLGNPGREYETTKHNVGFMVVDEIAKQVEHTPWREDKKALVSSYYEGEEKVLLVKPQTFMNLSGESVAPLMRYYKLDPTDVFVVYDDMDIPVGTLRLRKNGSAGGHNGIKSLIQHMGTEEFPRFRLGIGRPLPGWTVVNHVLAPFTEENQEKIQKGVLSMAKAVRGTVKLGMDKGMNRYNPVRGKR